MPSGSHLPTPEASQAVESFSLVQVCPEVVAAARLPQATQLGSRIPPGQGGREGSPCDREGCEWAGLRCEGSPLADLVPNPHHLTCQPTEDSLCCFPLGPQPGFPLAGSFPRSQCLFHLSRLSWFLSKLWEDPGTSPGPRREPPLGALAHPRDTPIEARQVVPGIRVSVPDHQALLLLLPWFCHLGGGWAEEPCLTPQRLTGHRLPGAEPHRPSKGLCATTKKLCPSQRSLGVAMVTEGAWEEGVQRLEEKGCSFLGAHRPVALGPAR